MKFLPVSLMYSRWTGPKNSTKKGKIFDPLGKHVDEYYLDFTRIFKADKSSTSTVQNYQKTLHRRSKPAALYNVQWVAFTNCANWTECVT